MQYTEEQLNKIRNDFRLYIRNLFPTYTLFRHQDFLIQRIQEEIIDVPTGKLGMLMSMGPGFAKSWLGAECYLSFHLGHHPDQQAIMCSYSAPMANKLGKRCRKVMESPIYKLLFPNTVIATDGVSGTFSTTEGGGVYTVGRGGSITSLRADVIIGDDLIKNQQEIRSAQIMSGIPDFLFSTLLSRFHRTTDKTVLVWSETVWGAQSPVCQVAEAYKQWNWYNIPALCEPQDLENDWLGRQVGESIDERLITAAELEAERKRNKFTYDSLFQGRTININATYFQRANLDASFNLPTLPTNEKPITLVSIDSASVVSETSDYTVATYWLVYKDYWIIGKIERFKKEITELAKYCAEIKADYILVEKASSGIQLLQLNANLIPSAVFKSAEDKENHAKALNVLLGNKIFIRKSGIGLTEEEELLQFPFGVHDDVPLSILHGYRYLINNSENLKAQKSRPKKRRAGSLLRRANNI